MRFEDFLSWFPVVTREQVEGVLGCAIQMEAAERVMREDRDALRRLAE